MGLPARDDNESGDEGEVKKRPGRTHVPLLPGVSIRSRPSPTPSTPHGPATQPKKTLHYVSAKQRADSAPTHNTTCSSTTAFSITYSATVDEQTPDHGSTIRAVPAASASPPEPLYADVDTGGSQCLDGAGRRSTSSRDIRAAAHEAVATAADSNDIKQRCVCKPHGSDAESESRQPCSAPTLAPTYAGHELIIISSVSTPGGDAMHGAAVPAIATLTTPPVLPATVGQPQFEVHAAAYEDTTSVPSTANPRSGHIAALTSLCIVTAVLAVTACVGVAARKGFGVWVRRRIGNLRTLDSLASHRALLETKLSSLFGRAFSVPH
ncbi:hypothetical protein HDU96_004525 [Phlyctochytrium bullatum]|nr:hypothetical protein HDU96_004525 [Phlyctochytrium bullatum]